MVTAYGSAVGVVGSFLLAAHSGWKGQPPPTVKVTNNGAYLSEWHADEQTGLPPCNFYNASHQYSAGLCSHFAIARMSADTQSEALSRAMQCATSHETDCILSSEIGLSVPAAFVYDDDLGLKMVIAPKLLALPDGTSPDTRTIALHMPDDGKKTGIHIRFNNTVNVQFLQGVTRKLNEAVFSGPAAYCVQMLRTAFAEDCWSEID